MLVYLSLNILMIGFLKIEFAIRTNRRADIDTFPFFVLKLFFPPACGLALGTRENEPSFKIFYFMFVLFSFPLHFAAIVSSLFYSLPSQKVPCFTYFLFGAKTNHILF